jgi:hypothetical protein
MNPKVIINKEKEYKNKIECVLLTFIAKPLLTNNKNDASPIDYLSLL